MKKLLFVILTIAFINVSFSQDTDRHYFRMHYVDVTGNVGEFIKANREYFKPLAIDAVKENDIKNFSYASSSSVYGGIKDQPFKETMTVDYPISLYAATKKSNELVAFNYSHLFGINSTGLRFFTVYGPWGRPDMALFKFTKALFEDKPIDVYNYGKMNRDFTYIDDIVEGVIRVINNPTKNSSLNPSNSPYQIYNIGSNNPVSLMDFITIIESEIGKKFKINLMEIQPGDVPSTYADVSKMFNNLSYRPNTSLKKGVRSFIDWYKYYYVK